MLCIIKLAVWNTKRKARDFVVRVSCLFFLHAVLSWEFLSGSGGQDYNDEIFFNSFADQLESFKKKGWIMIDIFGKKFFSLEWFGKLCLKVIFASSKWKFSFLKITIRWRKITSKSCLLIYFQSKEQNDYNFLTIKKNHPKILFEDKFSIRRTKITSRSCFLTNFQSEEQKCAPSFISWKISTPMTKKVFKVLFHNPKLPTDEEKWPQNLL